MSNLNKYDFCLIIPTLHEERNILKVKLALDVYLKNQKYFICFVDDSKNSLTKNTITSIFEKKNTKILNCGKNDRCSAVKLGLDWCYNNIKSNYFIEMDGDLSHHPEDIKKNLPIILSGKYNLLIFSKYLINSKQSGRAIDRRLISFIVSKVCNFLFNKNIKDYSNGFRIYDDKALSILIKKKIIYKAPMENINIILFLLNKVKIKELASNYRDRSYGSSVINLKHYIQFTISFLKLIISYVSKQN
jgi:hypothetical protein|tara:strand:- start:3986 stop:4723 length:738 start_codon:yes stop_codon:yes gene_type:complete